MSAPVRGSLLLRIAEPLCRWCQTAPAVQGSYCGDECRDAQWKEYDRFDSALERRADVIRGDMQDAGLIP